MYACICLHVRYYYVHERVCMNVCSRDTSVYYRSQNNYYYGNYYVNLLLT